MQQHLDMTGSDVVIRGRLHSPVAVKLFFIFCGVRATRKMDWLLHRDYLQH